jgi:dTDP-N-acetylfucosamine:lipid II N-acetylfucosaminyltransferase
MNYHIMIDDKFIDGFIDDAEKVSPSSTNVYFVNGKKEDSRYVNNAIAKWIRFSDQEFLSIIKNATKNDKVIVHWYDLKTGQFLLENLQSEVPLYVALWGGEFYEDPYLYHMDWIHDKLTLDFVKSNNIVPDKYNRRPHLIFKKIWLKLNYKSKAKKQFEEKIKTIKRIDKLLLPKNNEYEVELIKKIYGLEKLDFADFNYDQNVDLASVNAIENSSVNKDEIVIQIGNSATESNNHADALFLLSKFKSNKIKLVLPMAYGNVKYSSFVKKHGAFFFNTKIEYVENFVPRAEYISKLKKTDVCIMYHNRQQAFGNCIPLLMLGKKLFLKKENSLFVFFQSIGVTVFDANEIDTMSFEEFCKPLAENQKNQNKIILQGLFSEEKRLQYLREIVN